MPRKQRLFGYDDRPVNEIADLSPRMQEVLRLVSEGRTNKQVAEELCVSEWTVKGYMSEIFYKLNIGVNEGTSRVLAARWYWERAG